eukprot:1044091-Pelagomonas_calceolata.AAC.9
MRAFLASMHSCTRPDIAATQCQHIHAPIMLALSIPARAHAPQLRCPMQTLLRMGGRRVPSAAAHPAAAAPAAVAMPACAAAVESCVS